MGVVRISQPEREGYTEPRGVKGEPLNWAGLAAGAGLLAGGVLLLTGHRRAGLVAAATGTTLALLDQQEVVRSWWDALPGYVDGVQRLLGQVEESVVELAMQRERLHRILTR